MRKITLIFLFLSLFLTACAAQPIERSNIDLGAYTTGSQLQETAAGEFETGFIIRVETDSQPQGLALNGTLTGGPLYLQIKDTAGHATAWRSEPLSGTIQYNETVSMLPVGEYMLWVAWDGPVSGLYNLYYVPNEAVRLPQISPLALVSGVGMLLVALAYLAYVGVRKLGWKMAGWGALAWVVAVALKFAWAIPLNTPVYQFLTGSLPSGWGEMLFNLYVGALTGIFEVLLVWLALRVAARKWPVDKTGWNGALAFGIGFGAVEALLLGLNAAAVAVLALVAPDQAPAAWLVSLEQSADLRFALAPISERIFVVLAHIYSCVLIFYSLRSGQSKYMWLAFIYKTLLDVPAAWAQLNGTGGLLGLWSLELFIAAWGLLGLANLRWLKRLYDN